jgi:hypothetical protein
VSCQLRAQCQPQPQPPATPHPSPQHIEQQSATSGDLVNGVRVRSSGGVLRVLSSSLGVGLWPITTTYGCVVCVWWRRAGSGGQETRLSFYKILRQHALPRVLAICNLCELCELRDRSCASTLYDGMNMLQYASYPFLWCATPLKLCHHGLRSQ